LLNRPLAARVWSVVPGGPLTRLQWQGEDERIWRSWGPERIQTGWWRGQPANRDYYQVETASGRRYWLFRRLRDGRWFLHGLFE
jgi:protein ImuB